MTTGRSLTPEPLTEPAWQPFGWLPVEDVDPRTDSTAWRSSGPTCT